jgi:uncharacterized membrane protein
VNNHPYEPSEPMTPKEKKNYHERRIDRKVRTMQIAAILCALFAAAGIAHGIHTLSPEGGWIIPVFAGVVAASALAALWHVVIGGVIGMVRLSMIIALFVAAVLLTFGQLGASAQAIATAVAGKSAMAAELTERVDSYAKAFSDAYAEATGWRSVAESAQVLSVGFKAQAESEQSGGHGTGKGQGPKYTSLMEASQSFGQGAEALRQLLEEAKAIEAAGNAQLTQLRSAAAAGDQTAFLAASGDIGTTIGQLNSIDPKPIIEGTGLVHASEKGINLSAETADWEAKASSVLSHRQKVAVPTFASLSVGEATRSQIFGAAAHGWILAGVIDVLPFFFLVLAFIFSREVWHNEHVVQEDHTFKSKSVEDKERLDTLRPSRHTDGQRVLPFRSPAE